MTHRLAFARRAYYFPSAKSFKTAKSSAWLATNRLSRASNFFTA